MPTKALNFNRLSRIYGVRSWKTRLNEASAMKQAHQSDCSGIGITIAAVIAMPVLAYLKRREARLSKNVALAADAVQSATCAYIALITLFGLSLNAAFHIP
jgi:divalent metal cation (Fe/Co/Zn/Cd) transporter